ncbi:MAG TPA: flavodoxin [Candidatus Fusicatenibacter merdavium]|uniref:Flavodoxin n=1 Tax=Candidatus Fusicatenibacter merdavium TaxID=2838600 RepID=A0A9D2BIQ2_9FIRM|nr:flavodoxin [Candidatus Fusicatenibacter merdavium]
MSKIKVVYWSSTGNTEAMAQAIAKGIESAGSEAELLEADNVSAEDLKDDAVFALGCPAMGAEELEDSVVEPLVADLEGSVSGKKIALFGSYDWGDGEWMRTWTERMEKAGAEIVGGEGLICNNTPDEEGIAACEKLGVKLAEA